MLKDQNSSTFYCYIFELLTYTTVGVKKYDFKLEFAKITYTAFVLNHSYTALKLVTISIQV